MDTIAKRQKAEGEKKPINSTREIKFSIASIPVNPILPQHLKGLYHKQLVVARDNLPCYPK